MNRKHELVRRFGAVEAEYRRVWIEKRRHRGLRRRELASKCSELEKRWKNLKAQLHRVFRPIIFKRDGHRCRVCGSKENIELARLYRDSLWYSCRDPAERYSEENMLTLFR